MRLMKEMTVTYLCSSASCSKSPIFCAICWRVFLKLLYCPWRSAKRISNLGHFWHTDCGLRLTLLSPGWCGLGGH